MFIKTFSLEGTKEWKVKSSMFYPSRPANKFPNVRPKSRSFRQIQKQIFKSHFRLNVPPRKTLNWITIQSICCKRWIVRIESKIGSGLSTFLLKSFRMSQQIYLKSLYEVLHILRGDPRQIKL
jgi:hypothetical protein